MRADVHMHCGFSNDSETRPEDMVESAIAKGLSVICFTDHYDKDNLDWGDEAIFDVESYFQKMIELQEEYRDQIDIRIGAEIGMQPYLAEYYQNFIAQHPFDFVIGSVHSVLEHDVALDFFQKHSDPEGYKIYFEEMLQDVQKIKSYDVLGHLDYIVRYSNQGSKGFDLNDYMDIIEEILKQVIAHGKGIEMNMSGLKYGLGAPHPQPEIIKRYRELGGEIITVGADGHIPEHIAYDYHLADDILKSCGFKYYTEFKGRKPLFVKI
ncbi:histidinol-phosphatase HisJ family protein [Dorea sp. AM58-8]|uniref:histidinol-phosphatase HisJ family protein n=1 Tax=Dorea sp. AM58-8 TaxID=2292346 RepID=UPI000E524828|nr:histidinol-phosphatase HisJ family protein [Dorea sp. AM58-8]RGY80892.1 PHP domain-containing protein [Dorea sp. AM58-8]